MRGIHEWDDRKAVIAYRDGRLHGFEVQDISTPRPERKEIDVIYEIRTYNLKTRQLAGVLETVRREAARPGKPSRNWADIGTRRSVLSTRWLRSGLTKISIRELTSENAQKQDPTPRGHRTRANSSWI